MPTKKNTKNALPTTAEIFIGMRSGTTVAAIFRGGAGQHSDKRRAKAKRRNWTREVW